MDNETCSVALSDRYPGCLSPDPEMKKDGEGDGKVGNGK